MRFLAALILLSFPSPSRAESCKSRSECAGVLAPLADQARTALAEGDKQAAKDALRKYQELVESIPKADAQDDFSTDGDFSLPLDGEFENLQAQVNALPDAPAPNNPEQKPGRVTTPVPPDQRGAHVDRTRRREGELDRSPNPDPGELTDVANDYLRGGAGSDASRVLDRVIADGGAGADAYRLRAAARFQERDWAGTYSDANAALQLDPSDEVAYKLAGASRMELSRLGLKTPSLAAPARKNADAGGLPSDTPRRFGRRPAAVSEPVFPALKSTPSQPFLVSAQRKLMMGDRIGALLDLTRHLEKDPRHLGALVTRAAILNRRKEPQSALIDADKALTVAADDPGALRERAYALVQIGRFSEALEAAELSIREEPGNALGHLYRAMALQGLGRADDALAAFRRAAELDPALRGFYTDAVAALGPDRAPLTGRAGLAMALLSLPLLGWGLWGGVKRLTGVTTRPFEAAAEVLPSAAATIGAGSLLGGVYKVGEVLGRGGMGVVYEAEDLALRRKVAIKQLRTPDGTPADQERFLLEARLVAQLSHPNIVQIFALIEEGGSLYQVFERVDGRPLHEVLGERRFSPEETAALLRSVGAALDHAHAARVIHRDLKPSNLMLTTGGAFKVMDFGIAHQASGAGALTLTAAWGTPFYMAPEQERGTVGRESDLYALACTAYELMTGGRPFAGMADKLSRRFNAPSLYGLPGGLDAFMARALDPDPARRYHSGAELAAAFESGLAARVHA